MFGIRMIPAGLFLVATDLIISVEAKASNAGLRRTSNLHAQATRCCGAEDTSNEKNSCLA
jgi:hypothetical protein